MPVTPPRDLGPTLSDGWEMPELVQHWQTSVSGKPHPPRAQGLSHPCGTARGPPTPTPWHQKPPRVHLLRCRFASPFLCLIAKSGLEENREVKALPSCTPRPQKARRDAQRAHRPSGEKLPWTPTLARSQDDARARLGDSLARRARAMGFGDGGSLTPRGQWAQAVAAVAAVAVARVQPARGSGSVAVGPGPASPAVTPLQWGTAGAGGGWCPSEPEP